jgi:hypothetical protein
VKEPKITYNEPAIFVIDPDAQRFVSDDKEWGLTSGKEDEKKHLYFLSSSKYSKTQIKRDALESSRSDPPVTRPILKTQHVSRINVKPEVQLTKICKKAWIGTDGERTRELKQDTTEQVFKDRDTYQNTCSTLTRTPLPAASTLSISDDLNEGTRTISPSTDRESTVLKTPEGSWSRCNWDDVCESSPIATPIFEKLPMPPLKTDYQTPPFTPQKKQSSVYRDSGNDVSDYKVENDPQLWDWTAYSDSSALIHSNAKSSSPKAVAGEAVVKAIRPFPKSFPPSMSEQLERSSDLNTHMGMKNRVSNKENHDPRTRIRFLPSCMAGEDRSYIERFEPRTPILKNISTEEKGTVSITLPPPKTNVATIQEITVRKEAVPVCTGGGNDENPNRTTKYLVPEGCTDQQAKTVRLSSSGVVSPLSEVLKTTPPKGLSSCSLGSCLRTKLSINALVTRMNDSEIGGWSIKEGLRNFETLPKRGENFLAEITPKNRHKSAKAEGHIQGVSKRGKPRILSVHH